ncbi:leucine-rich repeat-containing protein 70-like [Chironomus tepperi]|uniref:leucine-rich repeat-containing protein 70-like n=1 Tax=Chironomus tepperi TaxID=113505 RepID=UPI00391F2937
MDLLSIMKSTTTKATTTVILISILVITKANGFCPSKCICDGDLNNSKARCIGAGLDVVPIQLNPNVKHINLTDNKIATVYSTLSFYYMLETLDISNNALETLGTKNFITQENLRKLFLQRNVIKKLNKETFKGMNKLEVLDLGYNQISDIDPLSFSDLTRLTFLDLTNNSLISIENGVFQNLGNLHTLLLTNNQLLSISHAENFEYLRRLQTLDLSGNLIKQINNNSFQYMNHMQVLYLNGNIIDSIDLLAFDGLVQLQHLNLSDNNLTSVPTDQLSKLSNLTHLSLSSNFIETLQPVSFLNLFQLRVLQLDRLINLIRIDSRAFIDNVNLQVLSMNDNEQFSDLPVHLFHGNSNLMELSLKNNNFYQLDAVLLPLDQLQKLSLADNPFVCNCSLIWLWRLIKSSTVTTEEEIEMGNNKSNLLIIDKDSIGCDIIIKNDDNNVKIIRKMLLDMSEADISCPTNILTIISVILTVIFIAIICISILIIIKCSRSSQLKRRQQKFISDERQNIGELIIPQKIDKYELERYLAEQQQNAQHYQIGHNPQQQHHTINSSQNNKNQYIFQPNSMEYRSLKKWDQTLPSPSTNIHPASTASLTIKPNHNSSIKTSKRNHPDVFNSFINKNPYSTEDDNNLSKISNNFDDNDNDPEDHYENFDDNFLRGMSQTMKTPSTMPIASTFTGTSGNNSKNSQNLSKPHIVYV